MSSNTPMISLSTSFSNTPAIVMPIILAVPNFSSTPLIPILPKPLQMTADKEIQSESHLGKVCIKNSPLQRKKKISNEKRQTKNTGRRKNTTAAKLRWQTPLRRIVPKPAQSLAIAPAATLLASTAEPSAISTMSSGTNTPTSRINTAINGIAISGFVVCHSASASHSNTGSGSMYKPIDVEKSDVLFTRKELIPNSIVNDQNRKRVLLSSENHKEVVEGGICATMKSLEPVNANKCINEEKSESDLTFKDKIYCNNCFIHNSKCDINANSLFDKKFDESIAVHESEKFSNKQRITSGSKDAADRLYDVIVKQHTGFCSWKNNSDAAEKGASLKGKSHKLLCQVCGQLLTGSSFTNHLLCHSGEKKFKCNVCEKKFLRRPDLVLHSRIHTKEKPYTCTLCPAAFAGQSNLRRHLLVHRRDALSLCCQVCDRQFNTKASLSAHLRVHSRQRAEISCSECGQKFSSKYALTAHKLHHKYPHKKYACKLCGKSYVFKTQFSRHMNGHDGITKYPCHLCPALFIWKSSLAAHLKAHSPKQWQCKQCFKAFSSEKVFKLHVRKHFDSKPHACPMCFKKFAYRYQLSKHVCRVQNNETIISVRLRGVEDACRGTENLPQNSIANTVSKSIADGLPDASVACIPRRDSLASVNSDQPRNLVKISCEVDGDMNRSVVLHIPDLQDLPGNYSYQAAEDIRNQTNTSTKAPPLFKIVQSVEQTESNNRIHSLDCALNESCKSAVTSDAVRMCDDPITSNNIGTVQSVVAVLPFSGNVPKIELKLYKSVLESRREKPLSQFPADTTSLSGEKVTNASKDFCELDEGTVSTFSYTHASCMEDYKQSPQHSHPSLLHESQDPYLQSALLPSLRSSHFPSPYSSPAELEQRYLPSVTRKASGNNLQQRLTNADDIVNSEYDFDVCFGQDSQSIVDDL